MPDADRQRLFDQWARTYESSVHGQTEYPFLGYESVLDRIARDAGVREGETVLDLGIGTGNLAARLLPLGARVTGVDFSATMLEQVRARHPDIQVIQADLGGDLAPIEPPGPRFDHIVSAYVLHEFPLPEKVRILQHLASRCLKAGGALVIGDLAFPGADVRTAAAEAWPDRWDHDEYPWAADEMQDPFAAAGLSATYEQISPCAGVFVIRATGPGRGRIS